MDIEPIMRFPCLSRFSCHIENCQLTPMFLEHGLETGSDSAGMTIGPQDATAMSLILAERGHPVRKNHDKNAFTFSSGDKTQAARNKSFQAKLRGLGVLNNKHIPEKYLWSSEYQRLELLRGLMDTDGCCNRRGSVEFCNMNRRTLRSGLSLGCLFRCEANVPRRTSQGQWKGLRNKISDSLDSYFDVLSSSPKIGPITQKD